MNPFPFSEAEWSRVEHASVDVVNATLMDDDVLSESRRIVLGNLLLELRERYGDHPILLETEADFATDSAQRRELYLRSITLAERNGLLTYTARLSLAELHLTEFGETENARRELLACQLEVETHADEHESRNWHSLLGKCNPPSCGQTSGG